MPARALREQDFPIGSRAIRAAPKAGPSPPSGSGKTGPAPAAPGRGRDRRIGRDSIGRARTPEEQIAARRARPGPLNPRGKAVSTVRGRKGRGSEAADLARPAVTIAGAGTGIPTRDQAGKPASVVVQQMLGLPDDPPGNRVRCRADRGELRASAKSRPQRAVPAAVRLRVHVETGPAVQAESGISPAVAGPPGDLTKVPSALQHTAAITRFSTGLARMQSRLKTLAKIGSWGIPLRLNCFYIEECNLITCLSSIPFPRSSSSESLNGRCNRQVYAPRFAGA